MEWRRKYGERNRSPGKCNENGMWETEEGMVWEIGRLERAEGVCRWSLVLDRVEANCVGCGDQGKEFSLRNGVQPNYA